VTVGLPSGVHPVAVLGGDDRRFALNAMDGAALAASIAIAIAALRGRGRRALGAVALGGLWLAAPMAWKALVAAGVVTLLAWLSARLLGRAMRYAAWCAIAIGALVLGVSWSSRGSMHEDGWALEGKDRGLVGYTTVVPMDLPKAEVPAVPMPSPAAATPATTIPQQADQAEAYGQKIRLMQAQAQGPITGEIGGMNARLAAGGIAQGVAPVALTLPGYEQAVTVTRELVTKERPFTPSIVYLTNTGLAPLVGAWLACIAALAWAYRAAIARAASGLRERLSRKPDAADAHAAEAPPAPPPVVA
jgi:hypothetical protein